MHKVFWTFLPMKSFSIDYLLISQNAVWKTLIHFINSLTKPFLHGWGTNKHDPWSGLRLWHPKSAETNWWHFTLATLLFQDEHWAKIGDTLPLRHFSSRMSTEQGLPWSPKCIRSSCFVKCFKKKDANDPVTSRTTSKLTCCLRCPTHVMEVQKNNNNSGKALKEGRFKTTKTYVSLN